MRSYNFAVYHTVEWPTRINFLYKHSVILQMSENAMSPSTKKVKAYRNYLKNFTPEHFKQHTCFLNSDENSTIISEIFFPCSSNCNAFPYKFRTHSTRNCFTVTYWYFRNRYFRVKLISKLLKSFIIQNLSWTNFINFTSKLYFRTYLITTRLFQLSKNSKISI